MVFTLDEMKLLQAINQKSPHEYTPEEKVIVKHICDKNEKKKIKQSEYFRKYLQTDKGKTAHRKASRKYYKKKKEEKEAKKQIEIQKNKDFFSKYIKIEN